MDETDFNSTMTAKDAERLRRPQARNNSPIFPRLNIRGESTTNRSEHHAEDHVDTPDQTEVFQQVIAIIRWGVLGLLIILATPAIVDGGDDVLSTLLLGFAALTVTRHARPIRFDQRIACDIAILIEIAMSVASVALTGLWNSPLAVSLTVPIIVAGFARGYVLLDPGGPHRYAGSLSDSAQRHRPSTRSATAHCSMGRDLDRGRVDRWSNSTHYRRGRASTQLGHEPHGAAHRPQTRCCTRCIESLKPFLLHSI